MIRRKNPYAAAAIAASKPTIETSLYDNFKRGDLVFGLAKPRDTVIKILTKGGYTHTYSNALNGSVVELVIAGTADAKTLYALDEIQRNHYYFLLKHRDYLLRKPGKEIPARPGEPEIGAAYRRACKLLLTNRDTSRMSCAHVVISDIDWARVCDKEKSGLGVTDSEMRAAYRDHRTHGKNPNIFFYDAELTLLKESPWELPSVAEHFSRYEEKRQAKRGMPAPGGAGAAAGGAGTAAGGAGASSTGIKTAARSGYLFARKR